MSADEADCHTLCAADCDSRWNTVTGTLGDDPSLLDGTTSTAIQDNTSEWSSDEPPAAWIGDDKAHQVFVNAYFDFLNESNWTP